MKNFIKLFLFFFVALIAINLVIKFIEHNSDNSFTVTADTKIKPNSKISKYVSQEEVTAFASAYSNIYCDEESNQTLKPLRATIEAKNTSRVINFIKDNNLSVDVRMVNGETPLIYSSYFDDVNTTKALIELGADVSIKNDFGFNALARTIENNSFNTAKILLENGADINDSNWTMGGAGYFEFKGYDNIDFITVDKDFNYTIKYNKPFIKSKETTCSGRRYPRYNLFSFRYMVSNNMIEMVNLFLENGYKPIGSSPKNDQSSAKFPGEAISGELWAELTEYEDYKPMLDLLLKYGVAGKPTGRDLDRGYQYCLSEYKTNVYSKNFYTNSVINDGSIDSIIHKIYNKKHNKSYKNGNWYYLYEVARLKKEFRMPSPYTLSSYNYFIDGLNSYCPDKNSTFKSVEKYIEWANWYTKTEKIHRAVQWGAVYLEDKNMTLEEYMNLQYDDYINKIEVKDGVKLNW